MGRPKGFTREDVLEKAISVFWEKGLANTRLQDLEQATGVNKSGLYAEFKDKDDIFVASLRHYLATRGGREILSSEPKGWGNIERFLAIAHTFYAGRRGCFSISSLRDVPFLPPEAKHIVDNNDKQLKALLVSNIDVEVGAADEARAVADVIYTFFGGLCADQNSQTSPTGAKRAIERFMRMLTVES